MPRWNTFKYLGILIFEGQTPSSKWERFLQKTKKKFEHWGTRWLKLAGIVVLVKFVLTSLHIFQCSGLISPSRVLSQMGIQLRKFMWQEGKGNGKKFHMVNWDQVFAPKMEGGLGIRDPGLMNIYLGEKIVWKLLRNPDGWWKTL